jgi:hypothetical protein
MSTENFKKQEFRIYFFIRLRFVRVFCLFALAGAGGWRPGLSGA